MRLFEIGMSKQKEQIQPDGCVCQCSAGACWIQGGEPSGPRPVLHRAPQLHLN